MGAREEQRTRRAIGWLAAGAVAVFGIGALVSVPHVENQLTERVESDLAAAGFGDVTAAFSGQDATIHCPAPIADRAGLRRVVEDEWGVRTVAYQGCGNGDASMAADDGARTTTTEVGTTTTAAEATGSPLRLKASLVAGSPRILLSGAVPTPRQRRAVGSAAAQAVGAREVRNRLRVDRGAERETPPKGAHDDTPAIAGFERLLPVAAKELVAGHVTYDGRRLVVRGTVTGPASRRAITTATRRIAAPPVSVVVTRRATASTAQAARLQRSLNRSVSASPIPFATGTARLTTSSDLILDKVATLARRYAGVTVSVKGYTDSDGPAAANRILSRRRADAVKTALVRRGVPRRQLVAVGHGEASPVAPNNTAENKAKNRRVVFAVATN